MTRDQLQIVANTAWIILGPDGYGCIVSEQPALNLITIDIAGGNDLGIFHFCDSFTRQTVEVMRGDTEFNFIREVTRTIRCAISEIHKNQIRESMNRC